VLQLVVIDKEMEGTSDSLQVEDGAFRQNRERKYEEIIN
jgi:hypothetical protein